jgi:RNA polymerase sigma-B factor
MSSHTTLENYLRTPTSTNRDALVAAHHHLCRSAARRFRRPGTESADLEQVAALGLLKAIGYYRVDLRTPFTSYAWLMIVGELMHYVRDHERLVRIPRSLQARARRYNKLCDTLALELGRTPTTSEIAARMDLSLTAADEARAHSSNTIVSLDGLGTLSHASAVYVSEMLSVEERLALNVALATLSERERTILHGVMQQGLSQSQLAISLGISQSQVSKILTRAVARMRKLLA